LEFEFIYMQIQLEGIVIIVGNYGSGKTEVAINLAVVRNSAGITVRLADLDLVNLYFRSREARNTLTDIGIEVILPPEKYMAADLPILSPLVSGMIRRPGQLDLIDAGGDPEGARVLSTLSDAFGDTPYHMLQVVNPMRPKTNTIDGCISIRREIEAASRLKITGWIGNANMIDDTSPDDIVSGHGFMQELSRQTELPLMFITAAAKMLPKISQRRFSCPVLVIQRQLVPPWIKAKPMI
jgi:hypothetical protein